MGDYGVLVGLHVIAIDAVELVPAAALAIEQLHHADSGDPFLNIGIDLRDGDTDEPVAA